MLNDFFKKIKNLKIAVIGDVILDEYIFGEVERISPEAPVPVVKVNRKFCNLGGAANVALNIKKLGATPFLLGIIGNDEAGKKIIERLKENEIDTKFLIIPSDWKTVVKTRIIAQNQQMIRIDQENNFRIEDKYLKEFFEKYDELKNFCDGILIQDYEKGLLSKKNISEILKNKKPIFVDPKFENFFLYKNVTIFKPNLKEAEKVLGKKLREEEDRISAIKYIKNRIRCENLIMTIGEEGMIGIDGKNKIFKVPSNKVEVYDVTGAGDTVISLLTLSYLSGLDIISSAVLATIGAGIEVTKLGASPVEKRELTNCIKKYYNYILNKIEFIKE
ncbi:MAG: bifunctional ADP-heptose synthase [candidate division WOR-3 bacterium]